MTALRSDSQRLIYLSTTAGLVVFMVCLVSGELLPQKLAHFFENKFLIDRLDPLVWSLFVGPLLSMMLNYLRALRMLLRSDSSFTEAREKLLLETLESSGDVILVLLIRAFEQGKLLQVSLKSRKVYCGAIIERPTAIWRMPTHVRLLPKFSTVRDKDSLKWSKVRTDYPVFEQFVLTKRLDVLEANVLAVSKIVANDSSFPGHSKEFDIELLKEERILTLKLLEQMPKIEIEDWIKYLPLEQVESISIFDEESFERWFTEEAQTEI